MANGVPRPLYSTNMRGQEASHTGQTPVAFAVGTAVPADGLSGFMPGGLFCDANQTVTAGTASTAYAINIGTALSCNFNRITFTVAAD